MELQRNQETMITKDQLIHGMVVELSCDHNEKYKSGLVSVNSDGNKAIHYSTYRWPEPGTILGYDWLDIDYGMAESVLDRGTLKITKILFNPLDQLVPQIKIKEERFTEVTILKGAEILDLDNGTSTETEDDLVGKIKSGREIVSAFGKHFMPVTFAGIRYLVPTTHVLDRKEHVSEFEMALIEDRVKGVNDRNTPGYVWDGSIPPKHFGTKAIWEVLRDTLVKKGFFEIYYDTKKIKSIRFSPKAIAWLKVKGIEVKTL